MKDYTQERNAKRRELDYFRRKQRSLAKALGVAERFRWGTSAWTPPIGRTMP